MKRNKEKLTREQAHDSKPTGDHTVFTHFPNPKCEECKMTKTTRGACKTRSLIRGDEISPLSENRLQRSTKVLNLWNESRDDHTNAPIVENGFSYWVQSFFTSCKRAAEAVSCLQRFMLPSQKFLQTLRSSSKRVKSNNGRTARTLFVAQT